MDIVNVVLTKVDAFQRKHSVLGFPVAVVIKFGDDQAGYQAALITYYAFVSLFPLLLVAFSILPLIIGRNPELQQRIIHATLTYFPVVGSDLQRNIHTSHAHGIGLIIGVLFTLYGARGIANVLQDVSNTIWQVPKTKRPGFPLNLLRSLGIIATGGLGLVVTTLVLGFVTGISDGNIFAKALLVALALVLNSCVFFGVSRLATAGAIPSKHLLLGAGISGLFWQLLQMGGSLLVLHQLRGSGALYGTFAVVLGLLFWLYLQAEVYVYALEITVVKHNKLWPRNLIQPPFAEQDKKAYAGYAKNEKRKEEESIKVRFKKK